VLPLDGFLPFEYFEDNVKQKGKKETLEHKIKKYDKIIKKREPKGWTILY